MVTNYISYPTPILYNLLALLFALFLEDKVWVHTISTKLFYS